MRGMVLAVLAASATSVAGPQGQPPPPGKSPAAHPVVVWNTGNGWTTLTIDSTGLAHYDFHPYGRGARPSDARKLDAQLAKAELTSLASRLAACHVCALRPSGRDHVPEEGDQDVLLDLPSLRCHVSLPSNDWDKAPAARCAQALDAVTEHVRTTGKPRPTP